MTKKLWTFLVEFEGGTYISQYETASIAEAIARYNARDPSGRGAVPLDDDPIAIETTQGVFCASGLSENEKLILGYIIATEAH